MPPAVKEWQIQYEEISEKQYNNFVRRLTAKSSEMIDLWRTKLTGDITTQIKKNLTVLTSLQRYEESSQEVRDQARRKIIDLERAGFGVVVRIREYVENERRMSLLCGKRSVLSFDEKFKQQIASSPVRIKSLLKQRNEILQCVHERFVEALRLKLIGVDTVRNIIFITEEQLESFCFSF